MATQFARPLARIRKVGGAVCGAGMLVGGHHILTCAHVVDDALRRDRGSKEPPAGEVTLDLPFLGKEGLQTRVVAWYPMRTEAERVREPISDIAVLEIVGEADVSGGIEEGQVDRRAPSTGMRFVTYGFPEGFDNGTDASGEVRVQDPGGWLQVRDTQDHGYFIEPGFSGAPILLTGSQSLVGMATQADQDQARKLACIVPAHLLCQAWPPLAKPYLGLFNFTEEDADLFFGRAAFVEELLEKLDRHAFSLVVGPSGSGKSSVVLAGLAPKLREKGWLIADCRPGRDPVYDLAFGLAPLLGTDSGDFESRSKRAEKWAERLRKDPGRIAEFAKGVAPRQRIGGGRVLLIIDQFEQLFTADETAPEGAKAKAHAVTLEYGSLRQQSFLKVLEAIGAQDASRDLPIRAVATLRADFMGHALKIGALAGLMREADVKLGPMGTKDLTDAIRKPARLFGVEFEDGLVEEIVSAMKGRPGGLPLLQFMLERLWRRQKDRRLRWEDYRGADGRGGLETALDAHAEEVLANMERSRELGANIEQRVRRVMLRLVRLADGGEETPDARAVAPRTEFGDDDWALVQRLADERLVMIGRRPESGEETAEVVHEALIAAWDRLRRWLDNNRLFGLWRQRLGLDTDRWSGKREEASLPDHVLAEALGWLQTHRDDLNAREIAFIEAAHDRAKRAIEREQLQIKRIGAAQSRTRRAQQVIFVILSIVTLGIVGASLVVWSEWERIMIKDSNILATVAQQVISSGDAVTGQLLALEGLRDETAEEWHYRWRPWVFRTFVALQHATYVRREVAFLHAAERQFGYIVEQALFSADARMAFAFDSEGSLLGVWNAQDGASIDLNSISPKDVQMVDRFEEMFSFDNNEQIRSPDGRFVAVRKSGTIEIRKGSDGSPLFTVNTGELWPRFIVFSNTGDRFLTYSPSEGGVRLWDTRIIADEDSVRARTLGSDPDGNLDAHWVNIPTPPGGLINFTKKSSTRCLTPRQRHQFNLSMVPPQWCVRMQKWPMMLYQDTRRKQ